MKSRKFPISNYLDEYKKQSLQLFHKNEASTRTPHGTSEERLSVLTTWVLNFKHIRKSEYGMTAIRFLNASSFLNRDKIQKELVNVGEPRIQDKDYCDHLSSPLGCFEVIKLLTDLSLFKETHDSSLTVHRLVQEVIQENLTTEKKVESIVDAVRLLRFSFSKCLSPDVVLKGVITENHDRPSLHSTDLSRFYQWYELCLHAHEIKNHLERFIDIYHDVKEQTVFLPEVSRILYECALHLNLNNYSSQAKTTADFANRILDWGDNELSEENLSNLFPHSIPLSESVRRLIQYSCKKPSKASNSFDSETSSDYSEKPEIHTMRTRGNTLFREEKFQEAVQVYTSCINKSKGTNFYDPKFLSNRASAYLRLEEYQNALKDAEEYITNSPQCWKGYAKKALALKGLNFLWEAKCFAALAYYHDCRIFDKFAPFKESFPSLKQYIHICNDVRELVTLLSQLPQPIDSDLDKIIVLESGKYLADNNLHLENVGLVGVGGSLSELGVTLSFASQFGLLSRNVVAAHVSFSFNLGNWHAKGETKLFECCVTSDSNLSAFESEAALCVKKCWFTDCKGSALTISGNSLVEDTVFSGCDAVGLIVKEKCVLNNCKLHGNMCGLFVTNGKGDITGCQIYDNKKKGVCVANRGAIKFIGNEIFHNDEDGIFLCEKSSAVIEGNEIFENGWWGIETLTDASCRVLRNKIYKNKYGGVAVAPITRESGRQTSIIEKNKIFSNQGPGIDQNIAIYDVIGSSPPNNDVLSASRLEASLIENELNDNIEIGCNPPSQDVRDICSFCRKQGQVKKCSKCFTAGYCNSECEKSHCNKHKQHCSRLLTKYSCLVKLLPLSCGLIGDKLVKNGSEINLDSKLEPSGPTYAKPPESGKRFIVKIQACDIWRRSNAQGTLFAIQDHSLTINGDLDKVEHSYIYRLVRECGSNCVVQAGWKKKFFWALLDEDKMVRIFTSEFPPYQPW